MSDEPPKITENDIEASSDVLKLKVGSTEEEKQRWLENYLNFKNMKKIHNISELKSVLPKCRQDLDY